MEREVRYIQLPPLPEDIEMPVLEAIWLIARMNSEERKDALAQLQAMLGDEEQTEKPDYEKVQTILDMYGEVEDENIFSQYIECLRVAFDHWEQKDIYERAIKTAVSNGITNLSNYMLYNFHDKPEHLYHRMKMNVDMCDELAANIYSFPMKYHPINDPEFFMNRDFIGKHWNRKFIRAIQAVLNSTKGKVGKGKTFFEEAFGADEHRFWTILWMPETFIIYRFMFKDNLAKEWEEKFWSLPADKLKTVQEIVALNQFKELDISRI